MAQSPIDTGQDAGVSPPQGRSSGATIVMNASPGGPGHKPAEPPRPEQLRETIAAVRPAAESRHETDEPSIEEYMAALMARTKQFSTSPVRAVQYLTSPVRAEQPCVPPPVAQKTPPPSPAPASLPPVSNSPASPPDCRTAISELRELANISAQSSFNTHRAQRLVGEMHGNRLVAIVAMLASVTLLCLAPTVQSPAYITAVAAVTTACAFSLKYLALGRELAQLCAGANLHDRTGH